MQEERCLKIPLNLKTFSGLSRGHLLKKQASYGAYICFPFDGICPACGFDFIRCPEAYERLISGCPHCHRSYCE